MGCGGITGVGGRVSAERGAAEWRGAQGPACLPVQRNLLSADFTAESHSRMINATSCERDLKVTRSKDMIYVPSW